MSEKLTAVTQADAVEAVVIGGDLSKLTADQRVTYYQRVCQSLGLNPLTKPFTYIVLEGKLTMYATRDAADQLRKRDNVSIDILSRKMEGDLYTVTARASTPDGRHDECAGIVSIAKLAGSALANACMKAETKARRRVTLSLCGLGFDDTDADDAAIGHAEYGDYADVPNAQPVLVGAEPCNSDPSPSQNEAPAKLAPIAPTGNGGWWATLVKNASAFGYDNHAHVVNALVAEHYDQSAMDYAHRGDILECLRRRHEAHEADITAVAGPA